MFTTPDIRSHSLPYSSIITHIPKHFNVPITEPLLNESKELGEKNIINLGFVWDINYDVWVKNRNMKNEPTKMALTDHQIVNDVPY